MTQQQAKAEVRRVERIERPRGQCVEDARTSLRFRHHAALYGTWRPAGAVGALYARKRFLSNATNRARAEGGEAAD